MSWILALAFLLASTAASAFEVAEGKNLAVTLDTTLVSKYIWRGYDIYDDDPAFQPSVDIGLFDTGFGVNVWGSFALESGHEDTDELDYTLYHSTLLFEDETYAVDFGTNYVYYDLPNTSSKDTDAQEVGASIAFPSLIPLGPSTLVPSYSVGYLWPRGDEAAFGVDDGWFHTLGLSYDIPLPPLFPQQEEQSFILFADVTYNDGAFDTDPGFTHSTVGVSASLVWKNFSLRPFANYQWSFKDDLDDNFNPEDELYGGVSLGFAF